MISLVGNRSGAYRSSPGTISAVYIRVLALSILHGFFSDFIMLTKDSFTNNTISYSVKDQKRNWSVVLSGVGTDGIAMGHENPLGQDFGLLGYQFPTLSYTTYSSLIPGSTEANRQQSLYYKLQRLYTVGY